MVSCRPFTERRAFALACWWFLLAVATLLPATVSAAAETSVSLRGRGTQSDSDDGSSDEDPQPACSCDCCDVVSRLPGEHAFGIGTKCATSDAHNSDMCGAQCSPGKEDQVLKDEVVDSDRFCFFECKPAAGPKAPASTQCIAFSEEDAKRIVDKAGNPMDPAFLYGADPRAERRPFSSNLLGKSSRLINGAPAPGIAGAPGPAGAAGPAGPEPGSPEAVDPKKAKKIAIKGRASSEKESAEAKLEASRLREMENQKMAKLHAALESSGDGTVTMDPFAAIQDLSSAALDARVSAEKSAVVAAKAVKAYEKGRQKIWGLALSEAGKEVLRWQKYAENKAKTEYEARLVPTWQGKAIGKAQKASQPYIEGLLRAQESVKLYNEKGFAMANSAQALWKEAQAEADSANKKPRATIAEVNIAQSDMLDAREKAKEAQNMAMESRQYFATAAEVRKGIPQYQYNAQKAANAAVTAFEATGK